MSEVSGPAPRRALLAAVLLAASASAGPVLAQAVFTTPVNVSGSSSGSYLPRLVVPAVGPLAGTPLVFWHDFTGGTPLNWCASRVTGAWVVEGPCAPNDSASYTPRAASDSTGVLHLVWRDRTAGQDDIHHAQLVAGAWSTPDVVAATPGSSRNPVIAIDPFDVVHVMWEDDTPGSVRLYQSDLVSGAWTPAVDSGLPDAVGAFVDSLRIACDFTGAVHAAWQDGATSLTEIRHAVRPPAGGWTVENVSGTPGSLSAQPAIAIGTDGTVHLAWVEQDQSIATVFETCYSEKPPGGAWSPRLDVSRQASATYWPAIAMGSDDVPRIAWSVGGAGTREIAYVGFPGDAVVNVSQGSGDSANPTLAIDANDDAWIAWQEGTPPTPEIYAATTAVAGPVLLMVTKDEVADAVALSWTGGTAPWRVTRSSSPAPVPAWTDLTTAPGTSTSSWPDPGALHDGRTWFYLVD